MGIGHLPGRRAVAVIPARLASSRYPGKPLAPILGRPMIEHVYRRVAMSRSVDAVYVATCDEEIAAAVRGFGGRAIMTSPLHQRASDRVAEAARDLEAGIVVMVQGDEPMIRPEMIDLALEPFTGTPGVVCANLVARIETMDEFLDRNTIKVVMNRRMEALYFSREPIPTRALREFGSLPVYKQVCVIPFRRDFLLTYARLEPTPLEQAESVDMLRVLEHGYAVALTESPYPTFSVDTPADRERVEALLRRDALAGSYPQPY